MKKLISSINEKKFNVDFFSSQLLEYIDFSYRVDLLLTYEY